VILLISASTVARITDVSHHCLATISFRDYIYSNFSDNGHLCCRGYDFFIKFFVKFLIIKISNIYYHLNLFHHNQRSNYLTHLFLFLFFGWDWGSRLGFILSKQVLCLNHTSSPFWRCLGDVLEIVLQTICPDWPWTTLLPISAS
jgi:hypothetical protein